jgi:hypothetical protein
MGGPRVSFACHNVALSSHISVLALRHSLASVQVRRDGIGASRSTRRAAQQARRHPVDARQRHAGWRTNELVILPLAPGAAAGQRYELVCNLKTTTPTACANS